MQPVSDVEEAQRRIEAFAGGDEEVVPPVSDGLQDQLGMNMAIITDCLLTRGWEPAGYEQRGGCRVYRYKAMK